MLKLVFVAEFGDIYINRSRFGKRINSTGLFRPTAKYTIFLLSLGVNDKIVHVFRPCFNQSRFSRWNV